MLEAFADKEFLKKRVLAKVGKGGKTAPKHVYMYSKDGEYIRDFLSITDAAQYINKNGATISVAIDSPTRTAGGFKWYSKKKEPTQ
jgi:hypothetical protein